MTTGSGVELIGDWFGTGPDRGIALVFTITGLLGLALSLFALRTKYYRLLSDRYLHGGVHRQLCSSGAHGTGAFARQRWAAGEQGCP